MVKKKNSNTKAGRKKPTKQAAANKSKTMQTNKIERNKNSKSKRIISRKSKKSTENKKDTTNNTKLTGKVFRGETKYIDTEPKQSRRYVVVKNKNDNVTVAKLKTIKSFDANGKNADVHLQEINSEKYGLEKRTGVDHETFSKNRLSGKKLSIKDKEVFHSEKEEFKLTSHDLHRVLNHINKKR